MEVSSSPNFVTLSSTVSQWSCRKCSLLILVISLWLVTKSSMRDSHRTLICLQLWV